MSEFQYGDVFVLNSFSNGSFQKVHSLTGLRVSSISSGPDGCFAVVTTDANSPPAENVPSKNLALLKSGEKKQIWNAQPPEIRPQGRVVVFSDNKSEPFISSSFEWIMEAEGEVEDNPISSISASTDHCLAVCRSGRVYSFGNSNFGCLGLGGARSTDYPEVIPALKGRGVVKTVAGKDFSIALTASGDAYSWGAGFNSETASFSPYAPAVSSVPRWSRHLSKFRVLDIACGQHHVVALARPAEGGGNRLCLTWGDNTSGQLGYNRKDQDNDDASTKGKARIVTRCVAGSLSPSLNDKGAVISPASPPSGPPYEKHMHTPRVIESLLDLDIASVAAGAHHTVVSTACGRAFSWGANTFGQLGLGDHVSRKEPFEISATTFPKPSPQGAEVTGRRRRRRLHRGRSRSPSPTSNTVLGQADGHPIIPGATSNNADGNGSASPSRAGSRAGSDGLGNEGTLGLVRSVAASDSMTVLLLSTGAVLAAGRLPIDHLGPLDDSMEEAARAAARGEKLATSLKRRSDKSPSASVNNHPNRPGSSVSNRQSSHGAAALSRQPSAVADDDALSMNTAADAGAPGAISRSNSKFVAAASERGRERAPLLSGYRRIPHPFYPGVEQLIDASGNSKGSIAPFPIELKVANSETPPAARVACSNSTIIIFCPVVSKLIAPTCFPLHGGIPLTIAATGLPLPAWMLQRAAADKGIIEQGTLPPQLNDHSLMGGNSSRASVTPGQSRPSSAINTQRQNTQQHYPANPNGGDAFGSNAGNTINTVHSNANAGSHHHQPLNATMQSNGSGLNAAAAAMLHNPLVMQAALNGLKTRQTNAAGATLSGTVNNGLTATMTAPNTHTLSVGYDLVSGAVGGGPVPTHRALLGGVGLNVPAAGGEASLAQWEVLSLELGNRGHKTSVLVKFCVAGVSGPSAAAYDECLQNVDLAIAQGADPESLPGRGQWRQWINRGDIVLDQSSGQLVVQTEAPVLLGRRKVTRRREPFEVDPSDPLTASEFVEEFLYEDDYRRQEDTKDNVANSLDLYPIRSDGTVYKLTAQISLDDGQSWSAAPCPFVIVPADEDDVAQLRTRLTQIELNNASAAGPNALNTHALSELSQPQLSSMSYLQSQASSSSLHHAGNNSSLLNSARRRDPLAAATVHSARLGYSSTLPLDDEEIRLDTMRLTIDHGLPYKIRLRDNPDLEVDFTPVNEAKVKLAELATASQDVSRRPVEPVCLASSSNLPDKVKVVQPNVSGSSGGVEVKVNMLHKIPDALPDSSLLVSFTCKPKASAPKRPLSAASSAASVAHSLATQTPGGVLPVGGTKGLLDFAKHRSTSKHLVASLLKAPSPSELGGKGALGDGFQVAVPGRVDSQGRIIVISPAFDSQVVAATSGLAVQDLPKSLLQQSNSNNPASEFVVGSSQANALVGDLLRVAAPVAVSNAREQLGLPPMSADDAKTVSELGKSILASNEYEVTLSVAFDGVTFGPAVPFFICDPSVVEIIPPCGPLDQSTKVQVVISPAMATSCCKVRFDFERASFAPSVVAALDEGSFWLHRDIAVMQSTVEELQAELEELEEQRAHIENGEVEMATTADDPTNAAAGLAPPVGQKMPSSKPSTAAAGNQQNGGSNGNNDGAKKDDGEQWNSLVLISEAPKKYSPSLGLPLDVLDATLDVKASLCTSYVPHLRNKLKDGVAAEKIRNECDALRYKIRMAQQQVDELLEQAKLNAAANAAAAAGGAKGAKPKAKAAPAAPAAGAKLSAKDKAALAAQEDAEAQARAAFLREVPPVDLSGGLNGLQVPVEVSLDGKNFSNTGLTFTFHGPLNQVEPAAAFAPYDPNAVALPPGAKGGAAAAAKAKAKAAPRPGTPTSTNGTLLQSGEDGSAAPVPRDGLPIDLPAGSALVAGSRVVIKDQYLIPSTAAVARLRVMVDEFTPEQIGSDPNAAGLESYPAEVPKEMVRTTVTLPAVVEIPKPTASKDEDDEEEDEEADEDERPPVQEPAEISFRVPAFVSSSATCPENQWALLEYSLNGVHFVPVHSPVWFRLTPDRPEGDVPVVPVKGAKGKAAPKK